MWVSQNQQMLNLGQHQFRCSPIMWSIHKFTLFEGKTTSQPEKFLNSHGKFVGMGSGTAGR